MDDACTTPMWRIVEETIPQITKWIAGGAILKRFCRPKWQQDQIGPHLKSGKSDTDKANIRRITIVGSHAKLVEATLSDLVEQEAAQDPSRADIPKG